MVAPDRDPHGPEIRDLIGVYNAKGTLRGELAYVAAKLSGRAPCALCDMTHQGLRSRRDFDDAVGRLPVRLELIHLDARSEDVGVASGWLAPCVLARTDAGLHLLLDPAALAACGGAPSALVDAIRAAAEERGFCWPAAT